MNSLFMTMLPFGKAASLKFHRLSCRQSNMGTAGTSKMAGIFTGVLVPLRIAKTKCPALMPMRSKLMRLPPALPCPRAASRSPKIGTGETWLSLSATATEVKFTPVTSRLRTKARIMESGGTAEIVATISSKGMRLK